MKFQIKNKKNCRRRSKSPRLIHIVLEIRLFFLLKAQYQSLQNSHFRDKLPYCSETVAKELKYEFVQFLIPINNIKQRETKAKEKIYSLIFCGLFINLQMSCECEFVFFDTPVISFCFIYSFKISDLLNRNG